MLERKERKEVRGKREGKEGKGEGGERTSVSERLRDRRWKPCLPTALLLTKKKNGKSKMNQR